MGSSLQHAKQPVSAALTGPYGHPFHPMLVTVPIGAWISSLVFDIAAQFRAMGGQATGEACIQYLCMTEDDIVRLEDTYGRG